MLLFVKTSLHPYGKMYSVGDSDNWLSLRARFTGLADTQFLWIHPHRNDLKIMLDTQNQQDIFVAFLRQKQTGIVSLQMLTKKEYEMMTSEEEDKEEMDIDNDAQQKVIDNCWNRVQHLAAAKNPPRSPDRFTTIYPRTFPSHYNQTNASADSMSICLKFLATSGDCMKMCEIS